MKKKSLKNERKMETYQHLNVHAYPLKNWDDPIPFLHGLDLRVSSGSRIGLVEATHRLIELNLSVRQAAKHLLHLSFLRILKDYLLP